jgi:hypothetical protein
LPEDETPEDEEAEKREAAVTAALERLNAGAWTAASFDPAKTPERICLLGTTGLVGTVSVLNAGGGTAKTQLLLLRAYALASGHALSGERLNHGEQDVELWLLEDPRNELEMRLAAIEKVTGVPRPKRLTILTRDDFHPSCRLIANDRGNAIINGTLLEALRRRLQARKPRLLGIDPFVKTHAVSENDNVQINQVVDILAGLATEFDLALMLAHHVSKGAASAKQVTGASRGASALVDGARASEVMHKASNDDVKALRERLPELAKAVGTPDLDAWRFVYVIGDKPNYAPPIADRNWFFLRSVKVPNGQETSCLVPFAVPRDALADTVGEAMRPIIERLREEAFDRGEHTNERSLDSIAQELERDPGGRKRGAWRNALEKWLDRQRRLADGTRIGLKKGPKTPATIWLNFYDYNPQEI